MWAWAGKRGYAHFARPSPHDLGVRTHTRIVGQPVQRGHANHTRPHISTQAHEKLATLGRATASTRHGEIGRQHTSTPPHKFGRPHISTQLHVLPRNWALIYAHYRPRGFRASTHKVGAHEVLGRPRMYMGAHISHLSVHIHTWRSTREFGRPHKTFRGRPHVCMDGQGEGFIGRQHIHVVAQKLGANHALLGHHCTLCWTPTFMSGGSREFVGRHALIWVPKTVMIGGPLT